MLKRLIAAATATVLAIGSAAAFVTPGGRGGASPDSIVLPVVDPPPKVMKKMAPPKMVPKAPVIKKAPGPIVKKTPGPIVKKTPLPKMSPKGPPVVKKMPPIMKGPGKLPPQFVHVRPHKRHKWYGRTVAGVVLGSILAASVYYTYSEPPGDNLCWYWTSSARVSGYWDYCEAPDDE